jgi:protein-disulfide isomerase
MWKRMPFGLSIVLALSLAVASVMYAADRAPVVAQTAAAQQNDFGQQIRNYLLANPEVVRDALLELERRDIAAQEAERQLAITQYADQLFNSDRDFVTGNPDGDVTLVEFFDYNCGFCRRAMSDLTRLLDEDPNLRVVLKEFPVLGAGSIAAAKVSAAAINEEQFFEFHKQLLQNPGGADGISAMEIAQDTGLDVMRIQVDSEDQSIVDTLSSTLRMAQDLGINGTPSYVVGNQLVVGAVGYDELKRRIAEERSRIASATN